MGICAWLESVVPRTRLLVIYSALIVLATLAIYWPSRGFEFLNYDDQLHITNEPHITGGLTRDNIIWAFTKGQSDYWIPVTSLCNMAACQVVGLNPGAHHLINAVLHALAS